jgi:CheY-like chemotaxis protein/HPt (histidine-containing phosphotransfer) domain-containing protein
VRSPPLAFGPEQPEDHDPARILLAEDNPANRKLALAMLAKLGYPAEAVSNGLEAVAAVARRRYVAILMDGRMPEMDGFQATAEIRRRERPRTRIPIIAMTADAMEGDRRRCLEAGMDDYISKPVSLDSLKEVLGRWVSRADPTPLLEPIPSTDGRGWDATLDPSVVAILRGLGERTPGGTPALVSDFLADASSNLDLIRDALERTQLNTAAERAHALAGTVATFGARRMGDLSRVLQRRSADGDAGGAGQALVEVDEEFGRVREALLAEFPREEGS